MTGAGSAELAFGLESSFLGSISGGPAYYEFGRDPQIQDASLENVLQRLNEPDSVWSVESVKENFRGAFGVTAVVNDAVFGNVESLVFNGTDGSGNDAIVSGRPQSATVYVGVDYLGGTAERAMAGFIPTDFSVEYSQDSPTRYTLTGIYADESLNTSITPGSPTTASSGGHSASHDVTVKVNSTTISKLQSATLSISNIARFQRDGNPTPADIIVAAPEAELTTTGIYDGNNRLNLAYGTTTAQDAKDRLTSQTGTFDVDTDGSDISEYALANVKPRDYSWADVISGDTDTTEQITWTVDGENAVVVK